MDEWTKKDHDRTQQLWLSLTFLSVCIEVAYCVRGLSSLHAPWTIPALLSAYHVGGMLGRASVSRRLRIRGIHLLGCAVLLAICNLLHSTTAVAVSLFAFGIPLQFLRSCAKEHKPASTGREAACKALGMIAGSVGAIGQEGIAILLTACTVIIVMRTRSWPTGRIHQRARDQSLPQRRDLLLFEFFHQAHYFCYVYVFWSLLPSGYYPYIGPLFILGWLVYWVLEWLLQEKQTLWSMRVVAGGHILVAVALIGMLLVKSPTVILSLWFITGAGGGTCYTIRNVPNSGNRQLFDDLGHLTGCLGSTALMFYSGNTRSTVVLAAVFATIAAFSVLIRVEE